MAALLDDLSAVGPNAFEWSRLAPFRYDSATVRELVEAGQSHASGEPVSLYGQIAGNLVVDQPIGRGGVMVCGVVEGSIVVTAPVGGAVSLWVESSVTRNIVVKADVEVIEVGGVARVGGTLEVAKGATVDLLAVHGEAAVGGLTIDGEVGDLEITHFATVAGRVDVRSGGVVREHIYVTDAARLRSELRIGDGAVVHGDVLVSRSSSLSGLDVGGAVHGRVVVSGMASVAHRVRIRGRIDGDVTLSGRLGVVDLGRAAIEGGVILTSAEPTSLVEVASVRAARFGRAVHLGDHVSIAECDFGQCGDLGQLDLVGADLFTLPDGTQAKGLEKPAGSSDGEMASIYRQLRVNLEGKGNRPASAFFYRGEMDSRRRAALSERRWGEWGWLSLYRLVAGYGLRVAPPLLWFAALVGIGGVAFHLMDLGQSWPSTFVFTVHSMLSLFRPPEVEGDWAIGLLQVALRLLGPILLGLAAFAVRDKVAR